MAVVSYLLLHYVVKMRIIVPTVSACCSICSLFFGFIIVGQITNHKNHQKNKYRSTNFSLCLFLSNLAHPPPVPQASKTLNAVFTSTYDSGGTHPVQPYCAPFLAAVIEVRGADPHRAFPPPLLKHPLCAPPKHRGGSIFPFIASLCASTKGGA